MKIQLSNRFVPQLISNSGVPALMALVFTLAVGNSVAATRTKAATGTDLSQSAAWDTLPTTADSATWVAGSLGGALTLGATQTWGALDLEDATANLTLSGSALTLSGGQTINSVANSGIYMATTGKDLSISNNIALGANQVWSTGAGRTLTTQGVVSGASTLTYGGAGSYIIGGINTNSGNLTIDTAHVHLNTGASLFCATLGWAGRGVTIQNGGVLETDNYANGAGYLWGQCGDGASNIILSSNGVFKMTGATMDSTVNKGISVTASNTGYFRVPTGTGTTWSGSYSGRDFTVNTGATLVFDGGGNLTTSRYISGAGNVTKNDAGTLKLTQNNTFTGTLTLNGGTVESAPTTQSGTPSPIGNNTPIVVNSAGNLLFSTSRGAGYHSGAVTINGGTITANGTDLSFACGKTLTFDTAPGTFTGTGQWRRRDASNKIAVTAAASGSTISVAELNLYDNSPAVDVADGTNAADLTISSKLTGTTLTKTGAGTLVLTNANAGYTSALTISAGTLELGGAGQLNSGSYAGNISNATTLSLATTANQTLSGVITGAGAVNKNNTGTLTLTGVNTYSGPTTINGGILELGGAGQLGSGAYAGNISNAGSLKVNTSANQTLSGIISGGSGALIKDNSGSLTLSGANTYGGTTAINAGTLNVTGSAANSPITVGSGSTLKGTGSVGATTVASGGALVGGDGTTGALTTGALVFNGTASLNVGTFSNYTSAPAIAAGTLTANGAAGSITVNVSGFTAANGTYKILGYTGGGIGGTGASAFILGTRPATGTRQTASLQDTGSGLDYVVVGATPYWTGEQSTEWSSYFIIGSKNWRLDTDSSPTDYQSGDAVLFNDNATGTTADISVEDVTPTSITVSGTKSFTFTGSKSIASGSLAMTSSGTLTINNTNTYGGSTTVTNGTLKAGSNSAFGTGVINLNGGTLDVGTANVANNIILNGGTLGGSGGTISGIVANGTVSTVTVGSSFTLAASNTYTGGTTINAGTLTLGHATNTLADTGAVTLNGGTLDLGSNSDTVGTVTLTSGAIVGSGGVLTGSGYAVSAGTVSAVLGGTGALTKGTAGTVTLTGVNTYTGNTAINAGTLVIPAGGVIGTSNSLVMVNGGTLEIAGGAVTAGRAGGTYHFLAYNAAGTFNMPAGSLTIGNSAQYWDITIGNTAVATYNQSGGTATFNVGEIDVGNFSGSGGTSINVSGGSFTVAGASGAPNRNLNLAVRASATVNISGTAVVTLPTLQFGHASGTASTATLNLDGGTLVTEHLTHSNGTANVYFNGGVLRAAVASAAFLQGLTTAEIKSGGVRIDTDGHDITIAQNLLENGSSPGGGLTKQGTGALALSGTNTYTGTTSVTTGSLVVTGSIATSATTVAAGAVLGGTGTTGVVSVAGTIAPGSSGIGILTTGNTILTGTYACEISGSDCDKLSAATLDITGATLTLSGTPTADSYVIATYTGTLAGSFHFTPPSGYALNYATAGEIKLVKSVSAFKDWMATFFPGETDPSIIGPDADPDHDGIPNSIEFVLKGGNPAVAGGALPPTLTPEGDHLLYTFDRDDRAKGADSGITLTVEAGTDLSVWPQQFAVGADTASSTTGVVITNDLDAGPDTVTVTIPRNGADAKFVHLKVSVNNP